MLFCPDRKMMFRVLNLVLTEGSTILIVRLDVACSIKMWFFSTGEWNNAC